MNRGIARRTVFEDRAGMRYFLSRLALAVHNKIMEVHAFALMPNHFHLLVRSPVGELSEGMRFAQNMYVRDFNREHRRDGPLFRGRFLSRPVESLSYRRTLVRYIDQNPVSAKLVADAREYPYGSARHYALGSGPVWLERSWVEADAQQRTGAAEYSPLAYQEAFGTRLEAHEVEFVEARLRHSSDKPDRLDELVRAAPESIARWMRNKSVLADGTQPGLPYASASKVREVVTRAREAGVPAGLTVSDTRRVSLWNVLLVALLRDVAGLRWAEIGMRVGTREAAARRRYRHHEQWMASEEGDGIYAALIGKLARECLVGR